MLFVAGIYLVNTLLLIAIALKEVERPVRALLWMALDVLLPLVGFVVFLLLSIPLGIKRQGFDEAPATHAAAATNGTGTTGDFSSCRAGNGDLSTRLANAMYQMTGSQPLSGQVQVLTNGHETYAALLRSLESAQLSIDIEYYIFRADTVGRLIIDTLIERALAGVQIRFLRDGLGSRGFPKSILLEMAAVGIECKSLFPLRFPWLTKTLNHRDHCKIVVVDNSEGFVGGINIGDEYLGAKSAIGPWRDTHLRLLGEPVRDLIKIFQANWGIATADAIHLPANTHANRQTPAQAEGYDAQRQKAHLQRAQAQNKHLYESLQQKQLDLAPLFGCRIQTIQSGPDTSVQSIQELFFLGLTLATSTVDVTTPYFAPDSDIVAALKSAARRGVRVRLLLPVKVDHKLIALATRTYYRELLESGVKIYLYNKGVLHAKVMIVDGELAMVGAANFDMRSFSLNYEVCEVIYHTGVTEDLLLQFNRDLQHAGELTLSQTEGKPLGTRIAEKGARILGQWL